MTLFEPPVRRLPAAMLCDRGVRVADDPVYPNDDAARAVADHVALGAWCDPLAWAALTDTAWRRWAYQLDTPDLALWED